MKSFRNRLRSAVMAVPLATGACFSAPGAGTNGHTTGERSSTGEATAAGVTGGVAAGGSSGSVAGANSGGTTVVPGSSGRGAGSTGVTTGDFAGVGSTTTTAETSGFTGASGSSGSTGTGGTNGNTGTGGSTGGGPCAACDAVGQMCFPGAMVPCVWVCGSCCCSCGGSGTTAVLPASAEVSDGGLLDAATCTTVCADVTSPTGQLGQPYKCHLEQDAEGRPITTDQGTQVACLWIEGCGGRRPEGFVLDARAGTVGEWLAAAATQEAASVAGFRRLERELAEHGAPPELRQKARRAAREEIRHARLMARLARRFGGRPTRVRLAAPASRPLMALAVENELEGCVRETFGAALALWQSRRALDEEVRSAMEEIALDEEGHAELGWAIREWLDGRLDQDELARLDALRREAVEELARSVEERPSPPFGGLLGLPDAATGLALIASLQAAVWQGGPAEPRGPPSPVLPQ